MSEVADGPETRTMGRPPRADGARRSTSSGTVSTTCSRADDADVQVGNQRDRPPALPLGAVERDRPGVRAGRGTGRHGAVHPVERHGREVVVLHDLEPGRPEGRGQVGRDDDPRGTLACERRGHRRSCVACPHDGRAGLLDALDEERHHVRRGPRPALAVGARHVGRSRAVRQRGADPAEDGLTRRAHAPPTTRGTSGRRHRAAFASAPSRRAGRASSGAGRRARAGRWSTRATRCARS